MKNELMQDSNEKTVERISESVDGVVIVGEWIAFDPGNYKKAE